MLRQITSILLLSIITSFSACKKDPVPPVVLPEDKGDARALIINTIADSVYLTLSGHDIATGTLPHIITITLPPSDTLIIPRADLKNAYRYQYDWHTADYTYSNWFMDVASGKVPELLFDYYADTTDYMLQIEGIQRNEMLICLNGDGLSSTWKAVDAYDTNGVSIWSTLSVAEKAHSFNISRFHTVKHYFTDTLGKAATTNLSFSLDISKPRMSLYVLQAADSYILTNNLAPILQFSTFAHDTLFYFRNTIDSIVGANPPPYYKIARTGVE